MVAHAKTPHVTPQEYLHGERVALTKSEYDDGAIVAMVGATRTHVLITGNLVRHLGNQLAEQPCETYPADMRVRVPECNRYYYSDVVVVCGEAQFEDEHEDNLLNPTLLIEVLSPSTKRIDRNEKSDCYRTLSSLQTYVLVSQEMPRIEIFSRQADNSWRFDVARGLEDVLRLPSIGCEIPLSEIYARVTLPPDIEEAASEARPDNA